MDWGLDIGIINVLNNIAANTNDAVKSIKYEVFGPPSGPANFQTQSNGTPFSMYEAENGLPFFNPKSESSSFTIIATPYGEKDLGGTSGIPHSITFETADSDYERLVNVFNIITTPACNNVGGTLELSLIAPSDIFIAQNGERYEFDSYDPETFTYKASNLDPGIYYFNIVENVSDASANYEFIIEDSNICDEIDVANLIDATYLQGSSNPEPLGPILRVEEGIRETYIKFDLASFTGTISEARLEMFVSSDPGFGTLEVFLGSDSNWTETTLTGTNSPTAVGSALASISGTHALGQTKIWNLDVSQLTSGGLLTLIVKHSSGNDVAFASDETAQAPRLFITTSEEEGPLLLLKRPNLLSLSPNPAISEVDVTFTSPEGKKLMNDILIFDTIGRLVQVISTTEAELDGSFRLNVRSLESGIYFVKTVDSKGHVHQKQMVIKK